MSRPADDPDQSAPTSSADADRPLSKAAIRALAEAAERRATQALTPGQSTNQKEINGRAGPDPVRYGDWENKGLISDF